MNNNKDLKTIELRELQPILSRTFGEQLIVIRYTTKSLLQPGENYGSSIFSVHAVIKRNDQADEEDVYLVAKMPPPTEFQRRIFDSPVSFRKEIFMYESIIPHYKQLERDAGLKEDELFDILPKYYQSRLSLSPDGDFDDNAVILMENLKARGFYICDRVKGCDFEHSKVAVRAMARFHALGIAIRLKQPEYFELLKERSKCIKLHNQEFEHIHGDMLKRIAEDPEVAVYLDRCKAAMEDAEKNGMWDIVPGDEEPWSTICHTDFWVNNIMFHRDENGRVDDIKFVDFQNYLLLDPLRELVFYLFSSTDASDDGIEELMDLYHKTFIDVLVRMGCDTESFTRERMEAKLKIDAKYEFMHVIFMLKILTLNVQEDEFKQQDLQNFLKSYQGNQGFIQRQRKFISYFVQRDWI
ncbi:uncharacterized protein [Anoplolepis gracilipes]|uniref:uncharacterized protein n=1 Tax=Anoplolepis gracilipes TaxID=354296 RepID=UPI003BA1342A